MLPHLSDRYLSAGAVGLVPSTSLVLLMVIKICLLSAIFHGLLTPLLSICRVLLLTVSVNRNIPGPTWNFLHLMPAPRWDSTHIYQCNHATVGFLIIFPRRQELQERKSLQVLFEPAGHPGFESYVKWLQNFWDCFCSQSIILLKWLFLRTVQHRVPSGCWILIHYQAI